MRQVSREDGGPRKSSAAMGQPATTNSTPTKRTLTSPAEMTAVPLLQALLYRQRDELAKEREAVKTLQRGRAAGMKAVREEEAAKYGNLLSDLKSRLERDHEDALQRQKDAITKTLNNEMVRALKAKDAEVRRQLAEAREREVLRELQLRESVCAGRDGAGSQQSGANSGVIQKLQQEATALRLQNKQLEERLQMVVQADRQKVCDLRSQKEEHEMQLAQLRKTWQQEIHKLLKEIKSKDRRVSQLEQRLNMQKARMQEPGQQRVEPQRERRHHECECAEGNCSRVPGQRLEIRQASMKNAVEAEMVADPGGHVDELATLRAELQERDRIIAELQLGTRFQDKDRNRHRKEQMRQYYRHFMELEPVAELEEDSGAGEDSPTSSSSPSLSPQPYTADMWAELPEQQYHDTLYSCLLKEHLELQREYQFLQNRLKRVLAEPNRTRLKLEHELAAAVTHVRTLKRLLAEQEGGAAVLKERITQLQAETQDLREQNELLEFRILELEECQDNSSMRSHGPDTRDVWTDTESDDVSDSGVQSLPSSDSDAGIDDIKMETVSEQLKSRLQEVIKATPNTAERSCLQEVLALLENWECRVHDSTTAGKALRSSSDSNRIIATVFPFTDKSVDKNKDIDSGEGDNIKRHLKNTECLQESGIFEEADYTSQGTQTGDVDLETFVGEIKMPFEAGFVGDLSAEIERLNQFRERVEEGGHSCGSKRLLRVPDDLPSHRKELDYCRERLQLLEDKVRVYESSGDQQARLLAERLQREVSLSAQVKELSAKVQHLVSENRCLEEEKCELEEAENDTRLRCQKLEVKLVTLNECKADFEAQLQQERRTLGRLRSALANSERKEEQSKRHFSYLEVMLNKYEQRNYELEESEVDLRHRLEMLEICIPALIIWNVWRIVQDTRTLRTDTNSEAMSGCLVKVSTADHHGVGGATADSTPQSSVTLCTSCSSEVDSSRFTEVEQEKPIKKTGLIGSEEVYPPTEEQLRFKLQDLEAQVVLMNAKVQSYEESEDKYRKRITELEDDLEGIKSGLQVDSTKASDDAEETEFSQNNTADVEPKRCANLECMIKVQELAESEANMKKRIVELERKEGAYVETLQKADELWSDMETSYKRRISIAEDNEAVMKETIRKLQESEAKLRQTFRQENDMLLEKIQNVEENEKMFKERSRALETEKVQLTDEINHLRETLHSEQKELEKTKETVARPLKEELLKERRLSKALRNEINTVERDSQNRSRDQQAQINGLKTQLSKMSRDLVDLECTNGELKEEVETLEGKISELKAFIEKQKQSEEKLAIQMSQAVLQKEQELEEIKREMRFSMAATAHDELKEVDKCVINREAAATDSALKPARLELPDVQTSHADGGRSKTPATNAPLPEHTSQAPVTAKEVPRQPSEAPPAPPARQRGCKCSREVAQPPPVSTLSQKPVLRRWLLAQSLHPKECSQWRQC